MIRATRIVMKSKEVEPFFNPLASNLLGIVLIDQNATGVLTRFGKYVGMRKPGLSFCLPFIDKVLEVPNRQNQLDFSMKVMTKDNSFVTLEMAVQVRVPAESSADALFKMGNPERQIRSYVDNAIRAHVPNHTLDELFKQRSEVNEEIEAAVGEQMRESGFVIDRTQILNIEPDRSVSDAMNAVLASERNLMASRNNAEAKKVSLVKQAEAEAERRILQGRGTAGQRIEIMRGYEDGVEEMATKLGLEPREIIEFLLSVQELDTRERFAESENTKTVFYDTTRENWRLTGNFMKAKEVE